MSKRRRMFEIDVPAEAPAESPAVETKSAVPPRRGPMASAVRENAEAVRARAEAETAARAENDRLAHEHVRLKKLGLIVDLVPLDAIDTAKLRRDRFAHGDPELDDLVASIREIGLSNPIRVERAGGRFELIQGWRRLQAYRQLHAETGDEIWSRIPAGMVAPGDSIETSYRRMVDENLVRKDISFAEMATLARDYAADPETECWSIDDAVGLLFASAAKQKRSYIRAFAELLGMLEKDLGYPEAIPRNLGLDLRRVLSAEGSDLAGLQGRLKATPKRSADEEVAILKAFVEGSLQAPGAKQPPTPGVRKAKTTFRVAGPDGEIKCSASDGKLEIRGARDFSDIDRRRLEAAVEAFLEALAD
ncbi:MAG: ParB N-terminal domain-containing protein [Pseudomonadota bacterium]